MKSNKKKRLYIEYNKKYPDANKKESIGLKKRINKSFKKIKKKDVSKQIKYKKRKWKEYLEETEGVKDPIIKKQKSKSIKEFNNIEENENYILAEINIEEDNINEDIRIINTFEEYKRINNLDDEEDDYKYENEKEIKENCIIKINNKRISFNYFYKFKEKGKFIIKYLFKKNIKSANCLFSGCESLTNIDLSNFNTQNVTDMSNMFLLCNSLIKNIIN